MHGNTQQICKCHARPPELGQSVQSHARPWWQDILVFVAAGVVVNLIVDKLKG